MAVIVAGPKTDSRITTFRSQGLASQRARIRVRTSFILRLPSSSREGDVGQPGIREVKQGLQEKRFLPGLAFCTAAAHHLRKIATTVKMEAIAITTDAAAVKFRWNRLLAYWPMSG